MADIRSLLEQRVRDALQAALGDDAAGAEADLRPATDPDFGDYQANAAMPLAKRLGEKPRAIAERIVGALAVDDLCKRVEVAGPGFINLTLDDEWLGETTRAAVTDEALGLEAPAERRRVVIDYSSPNVAKAMHVGHLRSTVIGDCLARVLERLGHDVVRQNHLGDWGTQFGMLTEHLRERGYDEDASPEQLGDVNALYQEAKRRFDAEPDFAERSRNRVVALQRGEKTTLALWRLLWRHSQRHFEEVYRRLGVTLGPDDVRGESFYNDRLPDVVAALAEKGLLAESEGARVVFPEGFFDRDGDPLPIIVQKSDGGYLYATTDLAAARYRIEALGADWLIYVTDARQGKHFEMVFEVLREAGWARSDIRLDHVAFGTILGPDKRPFKTREGGTVELLELIEEAERRARAMIDEKDPDLSEADRDAVARAVGVGALKYGDLAQMRIKDYVFEWQRMLSLEGNTAPYLQNAYVRIRSIFRKGGIEPTSVRGAPIALQAPAERDLALKIVRLPEAIAQAAEHLEPHRLCNHLYATAASFHQFYEQCPVLKPEDEATRTSRLALADGAARALAEGLRLLGIDVVERM